MMKEEMAVIECCYDDHISYYELAKEHVQKLKGPHDGRNDIITGFGKPTKVGGDDEVDFAIVFDESSHDPTPGSRDEKELLEEIDGWLNG